MSSWNDATGGGLPLQRAIAIGVATVVAVLALVIGTKSFETINANEILVVQDPLDGDLHFHTQAGIKSQRLGKAIVFPKVISYEFEGPIRFNEGGHGKVLGSIQFRLPLDAENLADIYETYGNANSLENALLSVVTDKSIFMTGPLLSSTESYAEKRSNLIFWIEDQINNGVYQTTRRDTKMRDPITGEEKTVTIAEIAMRDGQALRQETSQLSEFGVRPFNFAVSDVDYDDTVEKQIQAQQQNIMAVQTAVAEARKAEQQALTVEQQGRANAATQRWEQEAIKAKEVTLAQQKFEVAKLDAQAADQERIANIRRGEGEAARRRALMSADNALQQRIDAYLKAQEVWANAVSKYQGAWVPNVVMGTSPGGLAGASGSGAMTLVDLLTAKTARDLGLDLSTRRATPPQP